MREGARIAKLGTVAVTAALAWAAPAAGQDKVLTGAGCVEDPGGPAACTQTQQGLADASGIAISPDGQSVYVAGADDDAIVHLQRGADGALTPVECIGDLGTTVCGEGADDRAQGLDGVVDVAVSPDGHHLFAVSKADDALVHFKRFAATGVLDPRGCFENDDATPAVCVGGEIPNMADPTAVEAIDPFTTSGGDSRVVVAAAGSEAVLSFPYATTVVGGNVNVQLTAGACLASESGTGCDIAAPGLGGANDLAFSPNPETESLYIAALDDDAVARFNYDPTSGTPLSYQGCTADPDTGDAGCAATAQGLDGVRAVAVTPDGRQVFAAGMNSDALVHFNRTDDGPAGGPDGALSPIGCINKTGAPAECAVSAAGLDGPMDVTVAPDGESVYVATLSDTVASFARRNPSGLLDPLGCIANPPDLAGCGSSTEGLGLNSAVAASPDGKSVYVTAAFNDAVVRFNRGVPGQPPPGGEDPDNRFEIVKVKRNKRKGTAKLTVEVPGPGHLTLARTRKLKSAEADAAEAGRTKLPVKPRGPAKRKLRDTGSVRVKASVTFTPTGGTSRTKSQRLKLVKR